MADQKPTPTQALAKYNPNDYNLVLPVTQVENLPAGTQVSVRVVKIDVKSGDDVYPAEKGKKALTKNALNRIATAAGISWKEMKRTDDRCHPHYCEFMVRGVVTDFDGTVREGIGTKTIDLREDTGGGIPGKDYAAVVAAAKKSDRDPKSQLDKAREFIAELCCSKACNRAVAAILAIKRSYTEAELAHPFVIPKLVPDTNDPQARNMVMASMFGVAGEALYGKPVGQVIDATLTPTETVEAPPDDDEELDFDPETGEVATEPAPAPLERAEVMARVTKAWNAVKKAGGTKDQWLEVMKKATGQTNYDGLTAAKLDALDKAVGAMK